jgi:hypothetical protein
MAARQKNRHNHDDLSILRAGGGTTLETGRSIAYREGTLLTNLFLMCFNRLGLPVEKIRSIGDGTGISSTPEIQKRSPFSEIESRIRQQHPFVFGTGQPNMAVAVGIGGDGGAEGHDGLDVLPENIPTLHPAA